MSEILWQPRPDRVRRSQMWGLMDRVADLHGLPREWEALRRWSITHQEDFWDEMRRLAGIALDQRPGRVLSGDDMLSARWFSGLEINYAAHLLRFDDDRIAIRAEDERGRSATLTYRQLRQRVARCAAALRAAGVRRGDRVAAFMPNVPETVIAMLAAASLGAAFSSCSPDFGAKGVLDRFGQVEPRVLFAVDGYTYNGKPIDCRQRVRDVAKSIGAIERVVITPMLEDSPDVSSIRGAVLWSAFVAETSSVPELSFEPLPFDHPLFIMYSSGTTGVPKCIVHGHGGTLLQHMKELMLHCDLRREDAIFYFTTCGWMMWNWLVSGLGVGATVVLYEGSPSHPDIHRLWDMAERLGVTVFGASPKFVAASEKGDAAPGRRHDLSALRCVLSTGSPLSIEQFKWVYEAVKPDLQLSSISGGTDIISCFMLGNPILPVRAGEIQCRGLGMDIHAFDDDAKPVIGTKGELVCTSPFPSQPTGFWNDPDGSKYRSAYFEHYPGVWRHGDFIEITEHGGVIVYGRSDATLNPGGVRIGTAEIYRQVEAMPEVLDSVVVGKRTDDDVEVALFVVLREGLALDDSLIRRIKDNIAAGATKRHVPRHIRQVTAVPHTISGKKVELAVAQMIHGEEVKNRDALANPGALDQYRGLV